MTRLRRGKSSPVLVGSLLLALPVSLIPLATRSGPIEPQQQASGLDLVVRPTERLETNAEAKAAFLKAAEKWETLVANPITVVVDVDFGPTHFGDPFTPADHDSVFRAEPGGVSWLATDYISRLKALFPNSPVLARLPTGAVPTDIGSIDTICGPAVLGQVVGLPDQLGDPPRIGFNSAFAYDFDPSDGIDVDKVDFVGYATHGFLHVLGYSTKVGTDPGTCMAPLDLFRVPPDTTLSSFQQTVRFLTTGGEHNLFLGDDKVRLLSTGLPDGTEGDGRSADHWKDDELAGSYLGSMDPTLRPGQHGWVAYNDLLAGNRLGYTFAKTAPPPRQTRLDSSGFFPGSKTPSFKIQGQGFVPGSVATFKGQNRGTIQNTPTELQVFLTPQDVATPGLGLVTVFNPTSIDSNPLFLNIPSGTAPCGGGNALCLGDRYRAEVAWATANRSGLASSVKLTNDTGYFWFFDPKNVEIVLKVLQGNNDHQWVFYGSLTSVRWSMKILDTQTGQIVTKFNPFGNLGSGADTLAFPTPEATPEEAALANVSLRNGRTPELLYADLVTANPIEPAGASPACTPGSTTLCLNGGRFEVQVDWRVPSQNRSGVGSAIPVTDDTGYFWFFNSANVELVIKVLDAPQPGKFWVFYGALSTVEYTITVTDKQTGNFKTYFNPSGTQASKADTAAF